MLGRLVTGHWGSKTNLAEFSLWIMYLAMFPKIPDNANVAKNESRAESTSVLGVLGFQWEFFIQIFKFRRGWHSLSSQTWKEQFLLSTFFDILGNSSPDWAGLNS